jgi:hypothetical protein
MRFLDLNLRDAVPDDKIIGLFREQLTEAGLIKRLFEEFDIRRDDYGLKVSITFAGGETLDS